MSRIIQYTNEVLKDRDIKITANRIGKPTVDKNRPLLLVINLIRIKPKDIAAIRLKQDQTKHHRD